MSQVSIIDIEGKHPQIPTRFNANIGFAIPIGNVLEILGDVSPAGSTPVHTEASGNTVTAFVQITQAIAATDATKIGLCAFDSSSFDVDVNGFVKLIGGSIAIDSFVTDVSGPVVGDGAGNVNVTGSTNIYSDGSIANTLRLELQGSDHALFVGQGVNNPSTSLATGSSGQLLQSSGAAADPAWTTSTYPSTNAQGDLIYGSASNVLSTLAKNTTATRYLANTGVSNAPNWDQINLSNGITGTLPVANGGTGSTGIIGIVAGDGSTYNGRTIQQPVAGITISNADGSAGDPTFALANDLAAVEGLSGTGVVSRTGSDMWATSSITNHAILVGNNTQGMTNIGPATNGQLLIGSTGNDPVLALPVAIGANVITGSGSLRYDIYNFDIGVSNLGITYNSGTGLFSITSVSGTALSSSNPAYVTLPSKSAPGTKVTVQITADQTFTDDNGSSTIIGNLFGLTTGIAHAHPIPFFIYAVLNDAENAISFMISRYPNTSTSPVAAKIGKTGSAIADTQGSFFAMGDPIVADYDENPCLCVGSFTMIMSSSDDWTIQNLNNNDGIGKFQEGVVFNVSKGQFGAASGKWWLNNGGSAPDQTTGNFFYRYTINQRSNTINLFLVFGAINVTGSGAVTALLSLPFFVGEAGSTVFFGFLNVSGSALWTAIGAVQVVSSTVAFIITSSVGNNQLTNASFSIANSGFSIQGFYSPNFV